MGVTPNKRRPDDILVASSPQNKKIKTLDDLSSTRVRLILTGLTTGTQPAAGLSLLYRSHLCCYSITGISLHSVVNNILTLRRTSDVASPADHAPNLQVHIVVQAIPNGSRRLKTWQAGLTKHGATVVEVRHNIPWHSAALLSIKALFCLRHESVKHYQMPLQLFSAAHMGCICLHITYPAV